MIEVRCYRIGKHLATNKQKNGQFTLKFKNVHELVKWFIDMKVNTKSDVWLVNAKKDLTPSQYRSFCKKYKSYYISSRN